MNSYQDNIIYMDRSFPIVGIGASAGGQEALLEFFKNLPPDPEAAFIVVTHLSPNYESQLDDIIARVSPIPTLSIREGIRVEKNRLYVMPESVVLKISSGALHLTPRRDKINKAINTFLTSLAHDQGKRAIAIIMSGTGTDGTEGVNEIHRYGGKVFIQTPASASFSSMPSSAITGDHPDVIASPAMLAQHICTLLALT